MEKLIKQSSLEDIRSRERECASFNGRAREQHLTYGQLYAKENPVKIERKWRPEDFA